MSFVLPGWIVVLGFIVIFMARATPSKPIGPGAIALAVITGLVLGPVSCLWAVWGCISAVLNVGWVEHWPLYWAAFLVGSLVLGLAGAALMLRAIAFVGGPQLAARVVLGVGVAAVLSGASLFAAQLVFGSA